MQSLIARRSQTTVPLNAGGFTIPQKQALQFWTEVFDDRLLGEITTFERPTGRTEPQILENDEQEGRWTAEEGTILLVDTLLAEVSLGAFKLTAAVAASIELLQDAGEESIRRILASRTSRSLRRAVVAGTGVGQPTGLFTATLPVSISGPVNAANLEALYAGVGMAHRERGRWLMSGNTLLTVINLGLPDSIFQMNDRGNFLYGRRIIQTKYAPLNQVVFGNLSYYVLKRAPEIMQGEDNQSLALSGRGIRISIVRVDGKPIVSTGGERPLGKLSQ